MFKIKLPNSEPLVMKYEWLYDVYMQSIDHMSEIQLWSCCSCLCSGSVSSRCLSPPEESVNIAPFTFTNTYSEFQWLLIFLVCPHTLSSFFPFFLLTVFSVHLYVLTLKLIISSPSSRLWQQRQTVWPSDPADSPLHRLLSWRDTPEGDWILGMFFIAYYDHVHHLVQLVMKCHNLYHSPDTKSWTLSCSSLWRISWHSPDIYVRAQMLPHNISLQFEIHTAGTGRHLSCDCVWAR